MVLILNLVSDWLLKLVPRRHRGYVTITTISIRRHGSEVDKMEVRFSTALAMRPFSSLQVFPFVVSLSLHVRASGTRVEHAL